MSQESVSGGTDMPRAGSDRDHTQIVDRADLRCNWRSYEVGRRRTPMKEMPLPRPVDVFRWSR